MPKKQKVIGCIRNFMVKISDDKVRAHAAEAGFFIIMSVFPVLMLLLTLLQFTSIQAEEIILAIEDITPFGVRDILEPLLESIYSQPVTLISWTAIAALWAAGKSVLGLTDGLNTIYRIHETRNYFAVRLRAACYTLVLVVSLVISLVILVFGYSVRDYVRRKIIIFEYLPDFGTVIPALLTVVILFLLFLLMYVFLPNRRMRAVTQVPGAIFAAVSWSVFSYAFSIYLGFAADNMSVTYGSLTTLVVVMLWLYACMYLWFLGAELNHCLAAPELLNMAALSVPGNR